MATRWQHSDDGAQPAAEDFETYLKTNWASLYRFCFHVTGNPYDAEHLLQTAATKLFRN